MSKTKKIILLASVFIILGIIGMIFTFPTIASNEESVETITIQDMNYTQLEINTENADINILSSDEEEPRVEYSTYKDNYEFDVGTEGNTLKIELDENTLPSLFNIDFLFYNTPVLDVYLPAEAFDSIHTVTNNGRISISNTKADTISLVTDNGRISASRIHSTNLLAESNNGRITLDQITGNIDANTNNGRIEIYQATNEITASTDNGSITVSTENLDYPLDLLTANGKIEVETNSRPQNATFDLRTDNGNISVFDDSDWDTVYGNGDNLIKMRTNNGSITIN